MDISRFLNAERLELELEFLTPAFLGGADQSAELRAAPFKAALRWWWRALYGNEFKDSQTLLKEETKLFGSTDAASKIRILLSVSGSLQTAKTDFPKGKKVPVKSFQINILDYLAYGLYQYVKGAGNQYNRNYIKPSQKFNFSVYVPDSEKDKIATCLQALLNFGGVGSRSRNGFGCMAAVSKNFQTPGYSREWKSAAACAYPTINARSQLFETKQGYSTWEEALSEIGIAYRTARTSLERKHNFERRGLVARPIEVKQAAIPAWIRNTRSPKQFIMHINRRAGKYYGQILYMPILVGEKSEQVNYDKMIDDMHNQFSGLLVNKTGQISQYLGARQ